MGNELSQIVYSRNGKIDENSPEIIEFRNKNKSKLN
jgi:hypothetical protein